MNNSDTSHYENVPFEVPENWEWIKLGECGDVITGMTPSKDNKLYYGGKIPFYKPTDLEQGEYTLYSSDTLSTLGFSQCRQLPCNSILVTCIGATIGKTGIIKSRGACNQQINAIVPYCFLNYQYLYYVCVSNYMQTEIRDNSSSTTLPILNKSKFSELMIPLPPLNEQFRIIRAVKDTLLEIENLDRERHNLRNQIHNIKNLVIELAISGKLVPHKPLDEPATELLRRINPNYTSCDNRHYENIPQNWEECALKDIVEIQNGFAFKSSLYSNDGVRVIRITNVQDGYIVDDSPKYYPLSLMTGLDDYILEENDLLMSLTGNVGRVAMMPVSLLPAALNQRVCCIKPKSSEICREFIFYLFRTESFLTSCIESGKGVAQLNVSTEWLKNYRVALPPKEEQRRIVKAVQNIMTQIDEILAEL